MPEYISGPVAILIIYLDEPILVTHGDDEIAVVSRINYGVSVRPIRIHVRAAGNVQMVEFIPEPNGVAILIQVNQYVSRNGYAGHHLLRGGNHNQMSVGQNREIVMSANDGDVAARTCSRCKFRIQLCGGQLPNDRAAEVNFLDDRILAIDERPSVIDQKIAVGH